MRYRRGKVKCLWQIGRCLRSSRALYATPQYLQGRMTRARGGGGLMSLANSERMVESVMDADTEGRSLGVRCAREEKLWKTLSTDDSVLTDSLGME